MLSEVDIQKKLDTLGDRNLLYPATSVQRSLYVRDTNAT